MIEIEALTKTYSTGLTALQSVSLSIGKGTFGLLGPNGAGKTTLMRIAAGILRPTGGKAMVDGLDIAAPAGLDYLRRHLGYLPQELGLHDRLTVEQELDFFAIMKGLGLASQRTEHVSRVLETTGLLDLRRQRIRTLSGGQKRRLGVAIALLGNPKILIVDEPTAGLDPEERLRFRRVVAGLGEVGTVILSTHIVEDISQICSQLAVIKAGRLLFRGSVSEAIAQAEGRTWTCRGAPPPDRPDARVVWVRASESGPEFRLVGQPQPGALAATPTLEDAYIVMTALPGAG